MKLNSDFPAPVVDLGRRGFIAGGALALAGCQTMRAPVPVFTSVAADPYYLAMYAAMPDEKFPIPAVDLTLIDVKNLRTEVEYWTDSAVGTIIVDTSEPYLYFIQPEGRAIRYGIGVGRAGFGWSGTAKILMNREWPVWTPPAEMIDRRPELEIYRYGMEPGLGNPLGARALYLFEGGYDTLFRLHGTDQPQTIGRYVSSGCIRLLNQDVIDLYQRTALGARIVVFEQDQSLIG